MHKTTRAVIKADSTIPPDRKTTAVSFLEGKADTPLPRLLVTQAEAARMLGVARSTVYRMVCEGVLCPVTIRGATRYRVEDLARLAKGEQG